MSMWEEADFEDLPHGDDVKTYINKIKDKLTFKLRHSLTLREV